MPFFTLFIKTNLHKADAKKLSHRNPLLKVIFNFKYKIYYTRREMSNLI